MPSDPQSPSVRAARPKYPSKPRGKKSSSSKKRPRILLVTPEICDSGLLSNVDGRSVCVKAGGLADVTAVLLDSLTNSGVDVQLALPHFRSLMNVKTDDDPSILHLCEDREFCYRTKVYDEDAEANLRASLAFQRDVIHYLIPKLKPDLVHCHDWMTGLIPAAARSMGIPTVFTMHNLHDEHTSLAGLEERGIDAEKFWQHLHYEWYPGNYDESRDCNPLSLLASAIHASDRVNTVSESFLRELTNGWHGISGQAADALRGKVAAGHARGILNALPAHRCPENDEALLCNFNDKTHEQGKRDNKREFQRLLGLNENLEAPLFLWPSRLDPVQKGCQLLADVMHQITADYRHCGVQFAFVADGQFAQYFKEIVDIEELAGQVAIVPFDDKLSRLGYAAADFILMPSSFEPCGLSQMIGLRFGSLPIVHATGGLRDTVSLLHYCPANSMI